MSLLIDLPQSVSYLVLRGLSASVTVSRTTLMTKYSKMRRHRLLSRNADQVISMASRPICASQYFNDGFRDHTASVPLRSRKRSKGSEDKHINTFVDCVRVNVKAGNGGDGMNSLASVFRIENAGPDGGDGGNGAHVLFKATKELTSLAHLQKEERGGKGVNGKDTGRDGKSAMHRIIEVPVGTIFRNINTRQIVAELTTEGSIFLAARGGAGGKGNAHFKSSENQTPVLAEVGGEGETFIFDIELRTMAHVGLIGFPNAGKSTLLRAISRARPRVAPYPFTTLRPHIGMVPYDDYVQIAVADIPGIIPDAHKNKGLGISFLRHIERCMCLLYVIDMSQEDPFSHFKSLKYELEQYQPGLSERLSGIVSNKMDLSKAQENVSIFAEQIKNCSVNGDHPPIFEVSGKMGTHIEPLLVFIRQIYDENGQQLQVTNS